MADDPVGGESSWMSGSRCSQLADIDDHEMKKRTTAGMTQKQKKRGIIRNELQEKMFAKEARLEGNNGSRYLIPTHTDEAETMEKVSPFFIKKAIDQITPNVTISRMREGKLMLKSYGIKIEEHPTLNFTKGVINCRDFKYRKDEEILEELEAEYVVEIRRFKDRIMDGKSIPSSTFVLIFHLGQLPTTTNIGFYNCRVKQYVPSPLSCFNCLQFGHSKKRCRGNRICAKCANLYHAGSCSTSVVCVNCRQEHHALSKECPIYEDECEIQKLRVTEKISIRKATRKRRLQAPNPSQPRLTKSFAEIVQHPAIRRTRPEATNENNGGAADDATAATTQRINHDQLSIMQPINRATDANKDDNLIGARKQSAVKQTRNLATEATEGKLTSLKYDKTNTVLDRNPYT
ncbi:uncharacterized protein LOC129720440 [Wyeomyia smithii]|uniref:uncharacterized protein LOC129720440 n=1 Tax=Wyeomyia smithii TaxID=174621 RepID=UPI0024681FD7|nr:uncharacterized protein LOC129720440 [Wyeomyia smithii]